MGELLWRGDLGRKKFLVSIIASLKEIHTFNENAKTYQILGG